MFQLTVKETDRHAFFSSEQRARAIASTFRLKPEAKNRFHSCLTPLLQARPEVFQGQLQSFAIEHVKVFGRHGVRMLDMGNLLD